MRLTTAGLLSYAAFVGCVLTRVSCCILRCVPALLLLLQAVRTPLGAFQQVTVCSRCEGQGQSFQACERCGGDGRERESKRIQLTVPAGVCVAGGGGWLSTHRAGRAGGRRVGLSRKLALSPQQQPVSWVQLPR